MNVNAVRQKWTGPRVSFRRAARLLFQLATLFVVAPLRASLAQDATAITPTEPLSNPDGSLAGFASTEPGVYFVVSTGWRSDPQSGIGSATFTTADGDPGAPAAYDLRLTLRPDYSRAAPAVAQLRAADPRALFFPLPSVPSEVSLFLPEPLGSVQAYLVPDTGLSNCFAMYYRLRFDSAQLESLRMLAQGGITLQGAITYEYPTQAGTDVTEAPLTVRVPEQTLSTIDPIEPEATQWLADLLDDTTLSLPGALDGRYSLGSGISVSIRNSTLRGRIPAGRYVLADRSPLINLAAIDGGANFSAQITFRVPELNLKIEADYHAQLNATLDLSTMRFGVERVVATGVVINGTSSAFYKSLIDKLTAQSQFTALISNVLTDELQRRILSQTLFGLESVL